MVCCRCQLSTQHPTAVIVLQALRQVRYPMALCSSRASDHQVQLLVATPLRCYLLHYLGSTKHVLGYPTSCKPAMRNLAARRTALPRQIRVVRDVESQTPAYQGLRHPEQPSTQAAAISSRLEAAPLGTRTSLRSSPRNRPNACRSPKLPPISRVQPFCTYPRYHALGGC